MRYKDYVSALTQQVIWKRPSILQLSATTTTSLLNPRKNASFMCLFTTLAWFTVTGGGLTIHPFIGATQAVTPMFPVFIGEPVFTSAQPIFTAHVTGVIVVW